MYGRAGVEGVPAGDLTGILGASVGNRGQELVMLGGDVCLPGQWR